MSDILFPLKRYASLQTNTRKKRKSYTEGYSSKSINELINRITLKTFSKITLGGCFVESINKTILISRENTNKVKVL